MLTRLLLITILAFPLSGQDFRVNLRQGLMAGEVSTDSALLQSRLTDSNPRQDPRWEGVRGIGGWARFEYSTDESFRSAETTPWLEALAAKDFIVKTKITGLTAAKRYYYRLEFGRDQDETRTSATATFRTLAGDAAGEYSLAVVTGMNYSFFHYTGSGGRPPYSGPDKELGYPALKSIKDLNPDFFVGTGDNVYYDHPGHRGRAQTRHEMRKKHHEQYSQQRFVDLFQTAATYWLKDDHDHRFNDSDAINPVSIGRTHRLPYFPKTNLFVGESGSGFAPSHELGLDVYREQMPIVDPTDPDAVTYRTHRLTRDLQVWFVEGRDYRSPNDMPNGPLKTIWGKEQKEWLKQTLLSSDATFKLLISPTPMVGPDDAYKRDNHVNHQGFRHEGDEFFAWLAENEITPEQFFIVCGDRHWQYHSVHPAGYHEYSTGALVDANSRLGRKPGDPNSTDPDAEIQQIYTNTEPSGGFLLVRTKPGEIEFVFYDEKGTLQYEHRREVNQ